MPVECIVPDQQAAFLHCHAPFKFFELSGDMFDFLISDMPDVLLIEKLELGMSLLHYEMPNYKQQQSH